MEKHIKMLEKFYSIYNYIIIIILKLLYKNAIKFGSSFNFETKIFINYTILTKKTTKKTQN